MRSIPLAIGLLFTFSFANAEPDKGTLRLWLDDCAKCHGDAGKGDTPVGRALKVVNYRDQALMAQFTDEHLANLIRDGKVRGTKEVMPAYRARYTDEQVASLVRYIRDLSKG